MKTARSPGELQESVYSAFTDTASRYGERAFLDVLPKVAAVYGLEPHAYSYAEALNEVVALEERYAAAGMRAGHRVGLLLENRPAFFFHWLALNARGASVVPLSAEWRSAEIAYVAGHSQLCAIVAWPTRVAAVEAALIADHADVVITTPDLAGLRDFRRPPSAAPEARDVDRECALLYTSGTTGTPKGCGLPNEYFLWAGYWYAGIGGLCEIREGAERLLTPLPMSHMNAMAYSTMVMLLTGGTIVPLDRFHARTWWQSVRNSRATIVHYLGVMPAILLGAEARAEDKAHAVRFGFGAGVNGSLHAAFEQRFGFPLLEAWAMTETGAGAVIIANHEPRKVGTACFGRAEPRIDYRIVDENGRDVPGGEPGELWVRSRGSQPRAGFFREYLKDPEATRNAWGDGYFHTGDIVRVDAEGDFHFVDRRKNVIRRSGENISAVEVEGVLLQHPGVASVGVAAVPDEIRGDEVMACVVPRAPLDGRAAREMFARELVELCLARLAYYKAPGYVAICERLPLTATEKIQRASLKQLALSSMGGETCVDLRALKKRDAA